MRHPQHRGASKTATSSTQARKYRSFTRRQQRVHLHPWMQRWRKWYWRAGNGLKSCNHFASPRRLAAPSRLFSPALSTVDNLREKRPVLPRSATKARKGALSAPQRRIRTNTVFPLAFVTFLSSDQSCLRTCTTTGTAVYLNTSFLRFVTCHSSSSKGTSTCSRHCDTDAGSLDPRKRTDCRRCKCLHSINCNPRDVNDQAWPAAGCCGDMNWCTSSLTGGRNHLPKISCIALKPKPPLLQPLWRKNGRSDCLPCLNFRSGIRLSSLPTHAQAQTLCDSSDVVEILQT